MLRGLLICGLALLLGLLPGRMPNDPTPADEKGFVNSIGMKLVLIPAGRFVMGSPESEAEREPEELQHEVALSRPFWMGAYEVTQAQYEKVIGKNPSNFKGDPDLPVEQVKWGEAVEFCQKLSTFPAEANAGRRYRLSTEAEWEYACRAGTTTPFPGGASLSSKQANFNGSEPYGKAEKGPYRRRTVKVGSYAANAWGLYDMLGNVSEWCSDWYDEDYYKKSPKEDPPGPESGVLATGFRNEHFRVVRGGSWLEEGRGCRAAYRFRLMPSDPYRTVGFRVVCVVDAK